MTRPHLNVDTSVKPNLQNFKESVRGFLSVAQMISDGYTVQELEIFIVQIKEFFTQLRQDASAAGFADEQFSDMQYALCAFFDERTLEAGAKENRIGLTPQMLQSLLFDEHLAGQGFFERITVLRSDSWQSTEVLEVYYLCLVQGFKGKYVNEDPVLLAQLTHDVRQDIVRHRRPGLTPSAQAIWPETHERVPRYRLSVRAWLWSTAFVIASACLALDLILHQESVLVVGQLNKMFAF